MEKRCRWVWLAVAAVLVRGTTLWAQAPAPAPAEAPPAEAPPLEAPEPLKLRMVPRSVQWNAGIQFDEEGRPQEHASLTLMLQVVCDRRMSPVLYRNLAIQQVQTNAGENLVVEHGMPTEVPIWHDPQQQPEPQVHLHLQLRQPTRPCRSIAELRGSMQLVHATGPLREAMINPLSKVWGKRVRIVNVRDGELLLNRTEQGVRVELKREAFQLLHSVRFYDVAGRELPSQGWGGGGGEGAYFREFNLEAPDDGQVSIRFYSELQTLDFPFTLRDVPMPAALNGGAAIDLAIEARELKPGDPGGPRAMAPIPAGPPQPRLEVQVLD